MSVKWNLDSLYPSFDSDKFKNDLNKLDDYIQDLNSWVENNLTDHKQVKDKMKVLIDKLVAIRETNRLLGAFAYLRLSTDVKNEDALRYVEMLERKSTETTKSIVRIEKWLGEVENLEEIVRADEDLKEFSFVIKEWADESRYLLDEDEEEIIAKMKQTGSSAWAKLQQQLTSTLLVDIKIDGEEKQLPLSVVRNMAYDDDRETRKKAYEAELAAYKKIDSAVAASLNGIKGEVITLCKRKGYKSPLDKTLIDSRMKRETLEAMLDAIKESLDDFRRYYKQKAKVLGYAGGLPFYELFAPVGEAKMKFTFDEAREFVIDNFGYYSQKLADFAEKAFENNWIDAEPREGKRGGAFCFNIHPIGESRILTNFSGSFSDVTTLAHELGHGYHGECLKSENILNTSYPMPLAETASIFCQSIVTNAALQKANNEQKITILENSLSEAGQVIVDIYSRFLFESSVFAERENSSLSVDKLKELMLDAQKKSYGDGLDEQYLHPYMWVCKSHYYSADRNYYNFPYAFGLLFGKGLYAQYLKSGDEFVKKYDELLAATGKNTVEDVAALMDIDVQSREFWLESLQLIKNDIDRFVELTS